MPKSKLQNYVVIVTLTLVPGATWKSAELDSKEDIGDHRYTITAVSPDSAEELALDEFHSTVPIGVLEDVEIDTKVYTEADAKERKI